MFTSVPGDLILHRFRVLLLTIFDLRIRPNGPQTLHSVTAFSAAYRENRGTGDIEMHKFTVGLLALVSALLVSAAPPAPDVVDGTWTASFDSFGGSQRYTWELAADGEKLTGKVISEYGEQQIRDGAMKGNKVSWTEVVTTDGNRMRMKYEGTLKGDKLKLTRTPIDQTAQGGPGGPDFGPGGFGGPGGGDSATAKRMK